MTSFRDALVEVARNEFVSKSCDKLIKLCNPRLKFSSLISKSEAYTFLVEHVDLFKRMILRIPSLDVFMDDEARTRFSRGGRLQSRVRDKGGGVPSVYDMSEKDTYFVLMEYIPGYTLFEYVYELKTMKDKVALFKDILYTVEHIHNEGIIHRDLKPDNIIIKHKSGVPYILDFGLSKELKKYSLTNSVSMGIGTPLYMPPEQMKSLTLADKRSDVYSLGLILYIILTGHSLQKKASEMDFEKLPPGNWFYIIERATDKKPKNRYQDISEFLLDVEYAAYKDKDECSEERAAMPNATTRILAPINLDSLKSLSFEDHDIFVNTMLLLEFNPGRFKQYTGCSLNYYNYMLEKAKNKLIEKIESMPDDNKERDI